MSPLLLFFTVLRPDFDGFGRTSAAIPTKMPIISNTKQKFLSFRQFTLDIYIYIYYNGSDERDISSSAVSREYNAYAKEMRKENE